MKEVKLYKYLDKFSSTAASNFNMSPFNKVSKQIKVTNKKKDQLNESIKKDRLFKESNIKPYNETSSIKHRIDRINTESCENTYKIGNKTNRIDSSKKENNSRSLSSMLKDDSNKTVRENTINKKISQEETKNKIKPTISNNFTKNKSKVNENIKSKLNSINSKIKGHSKRNPYMENVINPRYQFQSIFEYLIKLSEMTINFIKEMNNLQESIGKKVSNVKDLKQALETNKNELYNYAYQCSKMKEEISIISSMTSPQKSVITSPDESALKICIKEITSPVSEVKENNIEKFPQNEEMEVRKIKESNRENVKSNNELRNTSKTPSQEKNNEADKYQYLLIEYNKLQEKYTVDYDNWKKEINCLNEKIYNLNAENTKLTNLESLKINEFEKSKIIYKFQNY